jgi:regulatory protein
VQFKKKYTKGQVYQKLRHYCAYQDRSHAEAKEKAWSLGMRKTEVEELTARLIEEGCLNEERFAKAFAGGKFRIKQWGRVKIKAALKQKQISSYCIAAAMNEIDETKYRETLHRLAEKRWNSVKGAGVNRFVKMTKTRDFLLLKGYEASLVAMEIKILSAKEKDAG